MCINAKIFYALPLNVSIYPVLVYTQILTAGPVCPLEKHLKSISWIITLIIVHRFLHRILTGGVRWAFTFQNQGVVIWGTR